MEHPSGTMTFLFTDIEGSTRLWEQHDEAMTTAVERRADADAARFDAGEALRSGSGNPRLSGTR